MKIFLALLTVCVLGSLALHAQTLSSLEAQLATTQTQLSKLQAKLATQQRQTKTVQAQAQAATRLLLQTQAFPPALWQLQSLRTAGVAGAPLLAATARAKVGQLGQLQRRHTQLFNLYAQLQAEQATLAAVATAIRQTETRAQRRQRAILAAAGRDASQLAATLQATLTDSPTLPASPAAEPLLRPAEPAKPPMAIGKNERGRPTQGKVVVGFRQGEGAEREGVVLAAPAGSVVRAPLAGKVLFAEGFRQFGGLVIVEGADGHEEVLGGLGALNVLAGQQVKLGQALGELGPRGRLYWEVRVRGAVRNPLAGL